MFINVLFFSIFTGSNVIKTEPTTETACNPSSDWLPASHDVDLYKLNEEYCKVAPSFAGKFNNQNAYRFCNVYKLPVAW